MQITPVLQTLIDEGKLKLERINEHEGRWLIADDATLHVFVTERIKQGIEIEFCPCEACQKARH